MKQLIISIMLGVTIMAHGAQDYSNVRKGSFVQRLDDLAELAVRLGSPVRGERSGEVIYYDDFSNGLGKTRFVGFGTGNAWYLSSTTVLFGDYSIRLISGSDDSPYVDAFKELNAFNIGNVGFEAYLRLADDADNFFIQIAHYDGTYRRQYELVYTPSTQVLSYLDSTGSQQAIDTVYDIRTSAPTFHLFKVVGDFENNNYVRAIFDNTVYSLADIPSPKYSDATYPQMRILIRIVGRDGHNDELFVDSIIVTQNEY